MYRVMESREALASVKLYTCVAACRGSKDVVEQICSFTACDRYYTAQDDTNVGSGVSDQSGISVCCSTM